MSKGIAIWFGPEFATVIEALAKRAGMTPKEYAHRIVGERIGLDPIERTRGQYATDTKRVGRPPRKGKV